MRIDATAIDIRPLIQAREILRTASVRVAAETAPAEALPGQAAPPAADAAAAARLAAAQQLLRALADAPIEQLAQTLANLARSGVLAALFRIDPRDPRLQALLAAEPAGPPSPQVSNPVAAVVAEGPPSAGGQSEAALALAKQIVQSFSQMSGDSIRALTAPLLQSAAAPANSAHVLPFVPEFAPEFAGAPDPGFGRSFPAGEIPAGEPGFGKLAAEIIPNLNINIPAQGLAEILPQALAQAPGTPVVPGVPGIPETPEAEIILNANGKPISETIVAAPKTALQINAAQMAVASLAPFVAPQELPKLTPLLRLLNQAASAAESGPPSASPSMLEENSISIPLRNSPALGPIVEQFNRMGLSARIEYVSASPANPNAPSEATVVLHFAPQTRADAALLGDRSGLLPAAAQAERPLEPPAQSAAKAELKPQIPIHAEPKSGETAKQAPADFKRLQDAPPAPLHPSHPQENADLRRVEERQAAQIREIIGDRRGHEAAPRPLVQDAPRDGAQVRYDFSIPGLAARPPQRAESERRVSAPGGDDLSDNTLLNSEETDATIPRHLALVARHWAGLPMLLSDRADPRRWSVLETVVAVAQIALPAPA